MSGPISGSASTVSTDQKGNSDSDNKDGKAPTVQVATIETPVTSSSSKDGKVPTVQVETIETPARSSSSSKDGQAPAVQVDTRPSSSDQNKGDTPDQQANFGEAIAAALGSQSRYTDPIYASPSGVDPALLERYREYYRSRSSWPDYTLASRRGDIDLVDYRSDPPESNGADWATRVGQRGANRQDSTKKPAYVIGGQAGNGAMYKGQGYVIPGRKPQ